MRSMLVIAVAVMLAASGAVAAPSTDRPTLRLVSKMPLTIAGAQFRPGELIRIVVRGPSATQRQIRAARTGSFRVVLDTWTLDRCGTPVVIQAVGIRSGLVSLKQPPQPACPPPLDRIDP